MTPEESNIAHILSILTSAKSHVDIFGPLSGTQEEIESTLKKKFGYLAKLVHPDRAPEDIKGVCSHTFDLLRKAYEAAKKAITTGTYGQPFIPEIVLTSALTTYTLESKPLKQGEFSVIYRGIAKGKDKEILAKVSKNPKNNSRLEAETIALKAFRGRNSLHKIGLFTPQVLDDFLVSGADKRVFRVTIMPSTRELVSVSDILSAYPGGLPGEDAAWICRRVLAQTSAAKATGLVHCAITPDHTLVHTETHEPQHIGWAHSMPADRATKLTRIIGRWKGLYPPEILSGKKPTHQSDIYMAGKVMRLLFGTNPIHPSISPILDRCTNPIPTQRYSSSTEALDEFTKKVRALWGSAYRYLAVPEGGL